MTQYQPPPFQPQQPYPPQGPHGQQPYGQQPYGPPSYGQPPYRQPTNGVAVAGFVVAIVGLVISFVPFLGIVSWVICPVGLVLSIVGMTVATKRAGAGRGMAIAGIILSAIGLVICFLWAITFAAATNGSTTGSTYSYSAPSYSAPTQSAAGTADPAVPAGSFGQGTYTVGSEIAPGRYRTAGASDDSVFPLCMAARQSADGTPIGIPETTNNGPAYLTVRSSDGLVEFTGDCTWAPAS
jgi:hypothetical protein